MSTSEDQKFDGREWVRYEEISRYLLNRLAKHLGLSVVEGKQKIQGKKSGTAWEVDGKCILEGGEGFVILECRRYTISRINQNRWVGLRIV